MEDTLRDAFVGIADRSFAPDGRSGQTFFMLVSYKVKITRWESEGRDEAVPVA
jgi:hypothetical protein